MWDGGNSRVGLGRWNLQQRQELGDVVLGNDAPVGIGRLDVLPVQTPVRLERAARCQPNLLDATGVVGDELKRKTRTVSGGQT